MKTTLATLVLACASSTAAASPIEVAAGGGTTCALDQIGVPFCWGSNDSGALGDGTETHSPIRVLVHGAGRGHRAIDSGSHACKIDAAGFVQCWGRNSEGQFGDPGGPDRLYPAPMLPGIGDFIDVSVGRAHACAVRGNGGAFCWGANDTGALGAGNPDNGHSAGVAVDVDVPLASITSGRSFSCGVSFDGDAYCWGEGQFGRLGNGGQADMPSPHLVALPSDVAQITAGEYHACAILIDGSLYCWGRNAVGQLGIGNYGDKVFPTQVTAIAGPVAQVDAGANHTCAVDDTGAVYCWGRNNGWQLGTEAGEDSNLPLLVAGVEGASSVSAGTAHSCAVASGALYCWGDSGRGALGDGTTNDSATPVRADIGPFIFVDDFGE